MKIFISETDRQNARRVALMNLARFFGVTGWDIKTNDKLLLDLKSLNIKSAISILNLLEEYFKAYDEWFSFYQRLKEIEQNTKKEYILKEDEHLKLAKLIENRETTLNALQEKFDELQLSKFNRKIFGTDIPGIIKNIK